MKNTRKSKIAKQIIKNTKEGFVRIDSLMEKKRE